MKIFKAYYPSEINSRGYIIIYDQQKKDEYYSSSKQLSVLKRLKSFAIKMKITNNNYTNINTIMEVA